MDEFPSGYTGMGNDPANLIDPTGMQTNKSGNGFTGVTMTAPDYSMFSDGNIESSYYYWLATAGNLGGGGYMGGTVSDYINFTKATNVINSLPPSANANYKVQGGNIVGLWVTLSKTIGEAGFVDGRYQLAEQETSTKFLSLSVGEQQVNKSGEQQVNNSGGTFSNFSSGDWGNVLTGGGYLASAGATKIDAILKRNYSGTLPKSVIRTGKYLPYNIRVSTKALQNTASTFKTIGNAAGVLSLGITGYQLYQGQISRTEAFFDVAFGVMGFFPLTSGISIIYFGSKALYEYSTGNTVFEKPVVR